MADGVAIVIVSATNASGLRDVLGRVRREPEVEEVVVVLNAATDAVRAAAAGADRVLESRIPLGLAGAANLGADAATGGHLLHLHDDAFGEPGWVGALLAGLDADPGAGAAGPLTLGADGEPAAAGWLLSAEARTAPVAPGRAGDRPHRPDYCGSFSLLVRRDAWAETGGFDPRFHPSFFVDVDFALALRARGFAEVCVPRARVVHAGGGSSTPRFRAFAGARNRERLLAKWGDVVAGQPGALDAAAVDAAAARTYAPRPAPAQRDPAGHPLEREAAFRRAWADALLAEIATLEEGLAFWQDAARRHEEASGFYEAANRRHEAHIADLEARLSSREG